MAKRPQTLKPNLGGHLDILKFSGGLFLLFCFFVAAQDACHIVLNKMVVLKRKSLLAMPFHIIAFVIISIFVCTLCATFLYMYMKQSKTAMLFFSHWNPSLTLLVALDIVLAKRCWHYES